MSDKNRSELPINPEKMATVVEIKSWIALATVLVILAATLVWGFFGTMQLRQDVTGVLVRSGKIYHIYATDDSVLLDLNIRPDEFVEGDQTVARIEQIELAYEINRLINENAPATQIEALRDQLIAQSQIKASDAGRVVDVYVNRGDFVEKGTRIATIFSEPTGGSVLECLLFVPASQVRDIKKGMDVNIYPASISKKNYGNMVGTVAFISEYPVTYQYLFSTLGSEDLAAQYLESGACYELAINLVPSEETVTGYRWTTSLGPSKKFGNLTQVDASIIIDEPRPIDVFFFGD